jgi:twinkle protein
MPKFLPDDLDYSAYEYQTEAKVKVRPASVFADELAAEFAQRDGFTSQQPTVTSTKLAGRIEFLPGEITVWAGYSGHRKSMFTGQVALDLMAQDQRVLSASLEMQPSRTLARMARQATAKRFPSPHNLNRFNGWTDNRLWIFDHLGRMSPALMISVCRYFAQELGGQHAFIDSMMMVCASEEHLDEQKQFATDIVRVAQETGLHLHLVAHCRKPLDESKPPTKYDVRGSAAITDQAHNVVTVWANKGKAAKLEKDANDITALADVDAVVSVEKQRSGSWEGKAGFWFDSASLRFCNDRGSIVEPYEMPHQSPLEA